MTIEMPYTAEDHVMVLMETSEMFRKLVETFDLTIDYTQSEIA